MADWIIAITGIAVLVIGAAIHNEHRFTRLESGQKETNEKIDWMIKQFKKLPCADCEWHTAPKNKT